MPTQLLPKGGGKKFEHRLTAARATHTRQPLVLCGANVKRPGVKENVYGTDCWCQAHMLNRPRERETPCTRNTKPRRYSITTTPVGKTVVVGRGFGRRAAHITCPGPGVV